METRGDKDMVKKISNFIDTISFMLSVYAIAFLVGSMSMYAGDFIETKEFLIRLAICVVLIIL